MNARKPCKWGFIPRKVLLPNHGTFWFFDEGDGRNGPITPLDHFQDGELTTLRGEDSYAHMTNGVIECHHNVIGSVDDLIEQP